MTEEQKIVLFSHALKYNQISKQAQEFIKNALMNLNKRVVVVQTKKVEKLQSYVTQRLHKLTTKAITIPDK